MTARPFEHKENGILTSTYCAIESASVTELSGKRSEGSPARNPLIHPDKLVRFKRSGSSSSRGALPGGHILLALLTLLCVLLLPPSSKAQSDGGKFLDAKFCGDTLNLNSGPGYDNGSCQLWKLVPGADGWSRLQLKQNGKFLDAKFCANELNMNPGSTYDNGSCQLWKFVPAADGWSRLQIKSSGKFLDASYCTDDVKLSGESDFDNGACQLWRLVPAGEGWSRLQIKYIGSTVPVAASDEGFAWGGQTYGWYDDGWNGAGYYIIDSEFDSGQGYGGGEGWNGWHHHAGRRHVHRDHASPHGRAGHFRSLGHHGAVHFRSTGHRGPVHSRSFHRSGGGGGHPAGGGGRRHR